MATVLGDRLRLQFHLAAWALVGGLLGVLVHALMGVDWLRALLFGAPLGLLATPVSLSATYLCRAMPLPGTPTLRVAATSVTAAIVTAGVWAAIGRGWWQVLVRSDPTLASAPVAPLAALLVGLGALAYLLAVAVEYLAQASERASEVAQRALELQIGQREAELRALRAQVDPHFLFNSLNSIAGLIGADPDRARRMCQLLADFLRDSLSLGGAARIPLGREVALAEQYLRIEQVRFGERLRVQSIVSADSGGVTVPPLILQPLVENAVRHGVATCLEGGVIGISAERAGDRAVIVVSNPRDPDSARKGTGLGLDIVRRRLAAAFGDRAALAIEAAPEAYRVSVTLPADEASA
ncbi:MAG TPA: histidine kinase [Vicinamibacterales bacterium]|nr:histidine kinase [Vicinamibacterales bacterium]